MAVRTLLQAIVILAVACALYSMRAKKSSVADKFQQDLVFATENKENLSAVENDLIEQAALPKLNQSGSADIARPSKNQNAPAIAQEDSWQMDEDLPFSFNEFTSGIDDLIAKNQPISRFVIDQQNRLRIEDFQTAQDNLEWILSNHQIPKWQKSEVLIDFLLAQTAYYGHEDIPQKAYLRSQILSYANRFFQYSDNRQWHKRILDYMNEKQVL